MDNARLAEQLRKVLQRYHDSNITLSKKEMEVGDDVHFAGFMVGVTGSSQDSGRPAIKEPSVEGRDCNRQVWTGLRICELLEDGQG